MRFPVLSPENVKRVLNVVIVLVALFLCGLVAKILLFDRPANYDYAIAPHAKLSIDGVDWTKTDRTILVALGKGCKYCTESAQFYHRLVQSLADHTNVRFVAVFSEKETDAEDYLSSLGISGSEFRYVSLRSIGIRNLPTLAILDRNGIVNEIWIGKLPPRTETEIMRKLGLTDPRPVSDWLIDENRLRLLIASHEPLVILDVRDRALFTLGHKDGAKNIPLDELDVRATNELIAEDTVVLVADEDDQSNIGYRILDEHGFTKILTLDRDSPRQGEPPPKRSP